MHLTAFYSLPVHWRQRGIPLRMCPASGRDSRGQCVPGGPLSESRILCAGRGWQRCPAARWTAVSSSRPFCLMAQLGQQVIAKAMAPELLTHVNTHLGNAAVAPARVHPAQRRPPGNHAVGQQYQSAFFCVGSIPRRIRRTGGLKSGMFCSNALQINSGNSAPVFRLHGPDLDFAHISIPTESA